MSYLVLARKYRPRHFGELVGQEHVVQALANALTQQRLHHAYLFTGTRGVGKTTVSRILAKSLNCQGPDGMGGITAEPCGVCQACRDIDAGRFVDYTELDAASNRSVDEIQQLLEQAVYKPVQGRFKVFMIDEVHMLTGHAFNAMLKTLEEPPEYLKFVLATTDPQKVPVTVLSRCLQFNLRPMAMATLQSHLARVLGQEGIGFDAGALRLLARAARGSMRDALSLTDQAIAYGGGQVAEEPVQQMLGTVDQAHARALIEALASADGAAVVAHCDTLRRLGLSAASTLEEMVALLQRVAVWHSTARALPDDTPEDAAQAAGLARLLPADEVQLLYSICLHGRAELGLAPDEYAALVMVLLRFLTFSQPASGAEKKTLKRTEAEPGAEASSGVRPAAAADVLVLPVSEGTRVAGHRTGGVIPAAPATPPVKPPSLMAVPLRVASEPSARTEPLRDPAPAAPATPAWVASEDGDFWAAVVAERVASGAVTALHRELALQSQLVGRDADHWLLRVERESLNQAGSRERLQAALAAAGHAVRLSVEVGPVSDSPARRLAAAQAERLEQARRVIAEDPFVQRMVHEFGAKIVPGSIQPV